MHPILAQIPFVGIGLLACAAIVFALARPRLQDRLGDLRGALVAAAIAIAAGCAAAATGLVAWTGTLLITSYAVAFVLGFAAALALAAPRVRPLGIDRRQLSTIALLAIVAGMAGARARYVWENPERFRTDAGLDWRRVADLDAGGMVWYGGLIAAAAVIALWAWRRRLPVLALADAVAPAVALGLAIGRVGCFFNGCCFGRPCDLPWAVPAPFNAALRLHPTQLYETLAGLAICGGILLLGRLRPRVGLQAAAFCIGYGVWRFINEGLRNDYRHEHTVSDLGGWMVTNSQTTSILLVVAGLALASWVRVRGDRPASPSTPPAGDQPGG